MDFPNNSTQPLFYSTVSGLTTWEIVEEILYIVSPKANITSNLRYSLFLVQVRMIYICHFAVNPVELGIGKLCMAYGILRGHIYVQKSKSKLYCICQD